MGRCVLKVLTRWVGLLARLYLPIAVLCERARKKNIEIRDKYELPKGQMFKTGVRGPDAIALGPSITVVNLTILYVRWG